MTYAVPAPGRTAWHMWKVLPCAECLLHYVYVHSALMNFWQYAHFQFDYRLMKLMKMVLTVSAELGC